MTFCAFLTSSFVKLTFKSLEKIVNELAASPGGKNTNVTEAQKTREVQCVRAAKKQHPKFLNAKQINYALPGSIATHYGWSECNIKIIFEKAANQREIL